MNRLRFVGELIAVAFCTVAFCATLTGLLTSVLSPSETRRGDFIEYWASSKLLFARADPYDASLLLPVERSAGYPEGITALVMGNPPWLLPLIAPLGLFSAPTARVLWIAASLLCLFGSIGILARLYGPLQPLSRLLAATFAPVFACLFAGQITLFLLAGTALFLYLHRSRPFFAGAALWLCLLKPHLFILVACVLFAWIVLTSSYRILAGVLVSLGISTLFALAFDPLVLIHYRNMMAVERYDRLAVPCLSILLRHLLWPHSPVIQYIPLAIGCIWAILYFLKRRAGWSWTERLPLLLIVSVLVAPYSFLVDQVLLIPAVVYALQALQDFERPSSRGLAAVLAVSSAAVEISTLRGHALLLSFFYVWTVPFWLGWYLIATRCVDRERAMEPLAS